MVVHILAIMMILLTNKAPKDYCFQFEINMHCQLELEHKHSRNQNCVVYNQCVAFNDRDVHNSLGGTGVRVGVGVAHCSLLLSVTGTNGK